MAGPRLVKQLYINWKDSIGGGCQTGWTTEDQSTIAAGIYNPLIGAAAALSCAGQFDCIMQSVIVASSGTSSGPYSTVRDQAIFELVGQEYTRLLAIPAPINSIFLSDAKTIDMSNSLVVAFLDQVFDVLGDSYGNAWKNVVSGYRRRVLIGGS